MLQCAPMTTGPLWCSALYRIIWCSRWCYLQNAPFLMLKEKSETLTGNARYEGYSVDLISSISEILGQTCKWCLTMFGSHSLSWKILSKENNCQSQRKMYVVAMFLVYTVHINFFPAPSRDAEWTRDAVNFISRVPTAQVPTKLQENNVTKVTLLNKWRGTSLEIKLN